MATIRMQVAPAKRYSGSDVDNLYYHNGNAHDAFREVYVLAKQDMEARYAEPPQKKRRLNNDISEVKDEDYIVLAKARFELVCPNDVIRCLTYLSYYNP